MPELTCRALVDLVTAYLDDALPEPDRRRFEEHLGRCDACRTYVAQFRVTIEKLGEVRVDTLSESAQRALLDAFRNLPRP